MEVIKNPTSDTVSDIIDRRNESRKHMQLNYWDEWEDVYRSSKCLSKKIMVSGPDGTQVEDNTRTNVCMPETSLIIRRKTARLTASPPQINYTVPEDSPDRQIGDKLTAWAYQQYDLSGEAQQHRRLVHTGTMFGFAVSKLSWESVQVTRKFFKAFVPKNLGGKPNTNGQVGYRDRAGVMSAQGAPQDEIDGAVKELGSQLSDNEVASAMSQLGNLIQVPQEIKKYEGPRVKNVFPGDIFFEPGAPSGEESGWVVENYPETELWLQKMSQQTYCDPETGDDKPIFDPKAVAELTEMGSWSPNQGTQQPYDLRTRLRSTVLGQTLPLYPAKLLPGKRFDILEQHMRGDDGRMWITYVGNEKVQLGKMPYPWDMYGKTVYTEFVPLFDILSLIGDSTPRLLRFLQSLHNATVGARKDLVNQILRPMMKMKIGEDIADEQIQDRRLMRVIQVKNMDSLQPLIDHPQAAQAIGAANEEEAQILKMFGIAEPNLTNVETGTNANPDAGKTATTAILAAKSADALTQFEMDSLHWYLRESGQKKLWMLQQNESEDSIDVSRKFYSKVEALGQRYGNNVATISIDPMEIQEDIQVEPEAMSMLSVDDDIRRQSAMQMVQAAQAAPNVWDPYYVSRFYAGTIRGVDPDKAVPPPKPASPPPPKFAVSVAVKWPELPPDVQAQLLAGGGAQVGPETVNELKTQATLQGVNTLNEAATSATELLGPAQSQAEAASVEKNVPAAKGVNG